MIETMTGTRAAQGGQNGKGVDQFEEIVKAAAAKVAANFADRMRAKFVDGGGLSDDELALAQDPEWVRAQVDAVLAARGKEKQQDDEDEKPEEATIVSTLEFFIEDDRPLFVRVDGGEDRGSLCLDGGAVEINITMSELNLKKICVAIKEFFNEGQTVVFNVRNEFIRHVEGQLDAPIPVDQMLHRMGF